MRHPGPSRSLQPLAWPSDQALPPLSATQLRETSGNGLLLLLLRHDHALNPDRLATLRGRLTADEGARLEAYRRPSDRDLFLLGRSCLRQLLGLWLDQPPRSVAIEQGPHGKPFCPGGPQFNVSHSGSLILLGLHASQPVGVDVERQRPDLAWEPLARRVLSDREVEQLLARPVDDRPAGFLEAWCALEARLKASGLGFAGLQAMQAASLDQVRPSRSLWAVQVPEPYRAAAALAAPG